MEIKNGPNLRGDFRKQSQFTWDPGIELDIQVKFENELCMEILKNGTKIWHHNCFIHQNNDDSAVIIHDGPLYWFKNGLFHRDQGPVVTTYYKSLWFKNGL